MTGKGPTHNMLISNDSPVCCFCQARNPIPEGLVADGDCVRVDCVECGREFGVGETSQTVEQIYDRSKAKGLNIKPRPYGAILKPAEE